jgi:hypothetical protein
MPLPPGTEPPRPPYPPQANGLAIASLVLGIVSLATCNCLTAIPGIILGHMGLGQIRRSGGTQTGRGMALGGLVMGYIGLGLVFVLIAVYIVIIMVAVGAESHRW